MRRAGSSPPLRPDRYLRIAAAMRRENMGITSGFAGAAQRCPDRPGFVDELGTLTLARTRRALRRVGRGAAGAAAGATENHRDHVPQPPRLRRGTGRGQPDRADVLLLNTSFAGPALAEVVEREGVDAVIYDEEFTATIDRALADQPGAPRIIAWTDEPQAHDVTVEKLIDEHVGRQPTRTDAKGKTDPADLRYHRNTQGRQAFRRRAASALKAILDRTPWRAEETIVVVAPMFHAWGFSQLVFAASMACTIVTRRKFDPEATLELVDRHRATGLCVVPVMFDRIMELPDDVRKRYSGRSLRFAAASGSRMRPDVVIAFMDQFGDVIYNNYNATEAGMIATATPEDLRAAPDTAGKPAAGTEIRILDQDFNEVPTGEVGQIYVRNNTQFDGYTSGTHQGLPRRLHGVGRPRLSRRRRPAVRGRPRRRDDRVRR